MLLLLLFLFLFFVFVFLLLLFAAQSYFCHHCFVFVPVSHVDCYFFPANRMVIRTGWSLPGMAKSVDTAAFNRNCCLAIWQCNGLYVPAFTYYFFFLHCSSFCTGWLFLPGIRRWHCTGKLLFLFFFFFCSHSFSCCFFHLDQWWSHHEKSPIQGWLFFVFYDGNAVGAMAAQPGDPGRVWGPGRVDRELPEVSTLLLVAPEMITDPCSKL